MIQYSSWTITNWLNSVPWFVNEQSYLEYFYQFPWWFADWIDRVFSITEWWVSILSTIFLVCIILFVLFHFTTTNHN